MVKNVLDRSSSQCQTDNGTIKYHFCVDHRPRTQHRYADGLSKRTNDYRWREQQLEKLPPVAERWNFLSQDEFERLPTAPLFDVQGRIIPNHPDLPPHLQNLQPTLPTWCNASFVERNESNDNKSKNQKSRIAEPGCSRPGTQKVSQQRKH